MTETGCLRSFPVSEQDSKPGSETTESVPAAMAGKMGMVGEGGKAIQPHSASCAGRTQPSPIRECYNFSFQHDSHRAYCLRTACNKNAL